MRSRITQDLYTAHGEALHNAPDVVPWDEYPRPQLRRDSFVCLNGWWDFAVTDSDTPPCDYPERIRVPFSPESLLSGVHRVPPEDARLYYRRDFALPTDFNRGRVLLHVGAADQIATVWVNGVEVAAHEGGYMPFFADITDVLQAENTIVVCVVDYLEDHVLPYGKQCRKRGGMWYTPTSGLWQTVWLESVPQEYISAMRIDTSAAAARIEVSGVRDGSVCVNTPEGVRTYALKDGVAEVVPDEPRLWSPDDPYLYTFTVTAGEDTVESYFALRTIEAREVDGIPRLCLNGKPIFLHALLDQGYWSDGLFLPAEPQGFDEDVKLASSLGFNTLRKHIKIEPEQFYCACDRMGMLVWQDMVNNGDYSFLRDTALPTFGLKKLDDRRLHRDAATRRAFEQAMEQTVAHLHNHPCIVGWTIFNEGWGQFDSTRMYHRLREIDSSRVIDAASGWFVGGESDLVSEHVYFKPVRFKAASKPTFLSEFGGYVYKLKEHSFDPNNTYGYRFFTEQAAFENALVRLYEDEIVPIVSKGLCGAVYTQLADIEDETNGLVTYDRRVIKVDAARMKKIADALYREIG
ncbi:MAG: glycoside hydrolase family 2 [Clostridia bacterium]|nr:glycoside hydrolase family 2 [Clostridia bacterium]